MLPKGVQFNGKTRVRDIYVIDGDSLEVTLPSGERREVRLAGIDAPELDQPSGEESRRFLDSLILRSAAIYVRDVDDYGRLVAEVYSGRGHNRSLNLRMIRAGFALHYQRFGSLDGAATAEEEARLKMRGMWASGAHPVPPWEYRARKNRDLINEEPDGQYEETTSDHETRYARGSYRRATDDVGCLTALARFAFWAVATAALSTFVL